MPLVGTWIETASPAFIMPTAESCPSWARGLKQFEKSTKNIHGFVVPLVGTWIETEKQLPWHSHEYVVPLVGTWIETSFSI